MTALAVVIGAAQLQFSVHGQQSAWLVGVEFGSPLAQRAGDASRQRTSPRKRALLRIEFLEPRCTPASFVVNTLGDGGDVPGLTSLRDAIHLANATQDAVVSITFDQNVIGGGLVVLLSALPAIAPLHATAISIDGTLPLVPVEVRRDANRPAFRIFTLQTTLGDNPVQLDLSNLKLSQGSEVQGGGIHVSARCTANLYQVNVLNNRADDGGGIFNEGTVTLENSEMRDNSATFDGGGILNMGDVHVQFETRIHFNSAGRDGGGIFNGATSVITDSYIQSNTAANAVLGTGQGGGIFNLGDLQMSDSTLSFNGALMKGGGLYENGVTSSLTRVTISNNRADNAINAKGGGFYVQLGAPVLFTNCTLTSNQANHANSRSGYVERGLDYTWRGAAPQDPVFFEQV